MHNVRVLVVDDHKINRELVSFMLKKLDIGHDLAEDGIQALEMLNVIQYDLVLMDIFMPNMGGIECLEMIQKHENKDIANTRVVAVTAKPESKGLGNFFAILPKPLNMDFFQTSVIRFLT